jgi:cytochrome c
MTIRPTRLSSLVVAFLAVAFAVLPSAPAVAADEAAALALMKKEKCTKCHDIEKKKKGPAYKKLAAKYAGKKAEGEEKMWKNLTTNPKVKLEDGTEEEHKAPKISEAEIRNMIEWILSLK